MVSRMRENRRRRGPAQSNTRVAFRTNKSRGRLGDLRGDKQLNPPREQCADITRIRASPASLLRNQFQKEPIKYFTRLSSAPAGVCLAHARSRSLDPALSQLRRGIYRSRTARRAHPGVRQKLHVSGVPREAGRGARDGRALA